MKLPEGDNVLIPSDKLINYILSETHPTGKFKARLFRDLGFDETNVSLLEKSLRKLAESEEIKDEINTPYGIKYVLDGKLETPAGKTVAVRTLWIVDYGQKRPRFITVYPV